MKKMSLRQNVLLPLRRVGWGVLYLAVNLSACTPSTALDDRHSDNSNMATQTEQFSDIQHNTSTNPNTSTDPQATVTIDQTALDTSVTPIDPDDYAYPFALDSEPVKNYAQAFNITAKQAQHSMMLAMASPEVLGKVLDQIQGHYLGHSLIDGKDMQLVVYTDGAVSPSRFDYVLAGEFGRGLVVPVVVMPKSQATTPPQVSIATLHDKMTKFDHLPTHTAQ